MDIRPVLSDRLSCKRCIQLAEKPNGNRAVEGRIARQNVDGLKCSSKEFVSVLIGLKRFVDIMVLDKMSASEPLETSVEQRCC